MDRYNQLLWLAGDDILKIQALEKVPILDYFILLDKKIHDMKKAEQHARRPTKHRN